MWRSVIGELQPTIMCLQEVENRDVVFQLVREIEENHNLKYRQAFIDGFDFGTEQDVAIIYRDGLVEYSRREQTPAMYDSGMILQPEQTPDWPIPVGFG